MQQLLGEHQTQMIHTKRMCKSVMVRRRKHTICGSKLLDVTEALELRCIHDRRNGVNQADGSVDRAADSSLLKK